MIPSIVVGFVLLDAILLWALIGARGPWAVKLAALVIVLGFNFATWHALGTFAGWPTRTTPPKQALFIYGVVDEPDQLTHDAGAIYLWMVPLKSTRTALGYQPAAGEPRAYRLPYSEGLYKAVVAAQRLQKAGQPAVLGHGPRGHGHAPNGNSKSQWHAYRLPTSGLPRKETP